MKVSVYIPTRNRLHLLQRAIASVEAQTYGNIEIVVADDGSTDGTREFLQAQMASGRLVAVFMPKSGGACAARNAAIAASSGDMLTGLDDDDFFLPERIERFVTRWQALANANALAGVAGLFDSLWERTGFGDALNHDESRVSYEELKQGQKIGNQVFAPKAHYLAIDGFDPAMPLWQDWDIWLRMARRFGEFQGLRSGSYIMDVAHDFDRISTKSAAEVRAGMARLVAKNEPYSARQRCGLLRALSVYPSVWYTPEEWLHLLRHDPAALLLFCVKRLLGKRRYQRLRMQLRPGGVRQVQAGS